MTKKTEKELLEYINLQNKLELLNKNTGFEKNIKNPFETLAFNKVRTKIKSKKISYKFWFLILVVLFLAASVLFNGVISSKFDPAVYKLINNLSDQINMPVV